MQQRSERSRIFSQQARGRNPTRFKSTLYLERGGPRPLTDRRLHCALSRMPSERLPLAIESQLLDRNPVQVEGPPRAGMQDGEPNWIMLLIAWIVVLMVANRACRNVAS